MYVYTHMCLYAKLSVLIIFVDCSAFKIYVIVLLNVLYILLYLHTIVLLIVDCSLFIFLP